MRVTDGLVILIAGEIQAGLFSHALQGWGLPPFSFRQSLLRSDENHHRKFQPLGFVAGHQRDAVAGQRHIADLIVGAEFFQHIEIITDGAGSGAGCGQDLHDLLQIRSREFALALKGQGIGAQSISLSEKIQYDVIEGPQAEAGAAFFQQAVQLWLLFFEQ